MKEYWSGLGKITFFRKISEVKRGVNSLCVQENKDVLDNTLFCPLFVHFFFVRLFFGCISVGFFVRFLVRVFSRFLVWLFAQFFVWFLVWFFCPTSCRIFVRFSRSLSGSLSSSPVGNFSSGNTSSTFNFSEGFARSRQFRAISVLPSWILKREREKRM